MFLRPRKCDKTATILTLVIATALPVCAHLQPAAAQANMATSPVGKLEFDAASVRLSSQEFVLKGADFLNPASNAVPPQGGLFSWNVQLPWLINFGYDLRSSQTRRQAREALPKWAQESWFTVVARAEGKPSTV